MHKNRTILASKSMDFRFSKIHFKPSKECEKTAKPEKMAIKKHT